MKYLSIKGIKDIVNLWNIAFSYRTSMRAYHVAHPDGKLWGTRQICPDQGWTAAQGQVWWPGQPNHHRMFQTIKKHCFAWLCCLILPSLVIIPRYTAVRIKIECWWILKSTRGSVYRYICVWDKSVHYMYIFHVYFYAMFCRNGYSITVLN